MVYIKNDEEDVEFETTNDEDIEISEPELEELEGNTGDKLKQLRTKITRLEEEKKQIMEDGQRARADFLNARKRLEDERARDKVRFQMKHVEELLPLCDSFQMAMSNKETWEKADENWRNGVSGIYNQLMRIVDSYGVKAIDPAGEEFDPYRDEAIGTEVVEDEKMVDKVISVLQRGYEMKVGDSIEVIRHAKVTTGVLKN
ncbi:MAG: hypothetical protein RLZZ230_443 [Candidatus Parcubacteria bacterium]|jgi:molecular chaperone GrpE